jgi:hypothetical protein
LFSDEVELKLRNEEVEERSSGVSALTAVSSSSSDWGSKTTEAAGEVAVVLGGMVW